MKESIKWEYYKYKRYCSIIKHKFSGKYFSQYAKRNLLSEKEGNDKIYNLLCSDLPCVISRFGQTEMSILAYREAKKLNKKEENNDANLETNAGFFPCDPNLIDNFSDYILESIHNIDLLGIWYNRAEEFIVEKYMPSTSVTGLTGLEPYLFSEPWSRCLKGKKILVVHPFIESIKQQYIIHDKLFNNKEILPDFELITLKAVQTIAGERDERFSTWFDALGYMEKQMDNIDYDIAIIGCGAYGMPLALHAKDMGKKAVHMGGATQILFGVSGRRWDQNPNISKFYNEFWIRPNQNEMVLGQSKVENACYW